MVFNLNVLSKNKIEPNEAIELIEPKVDFSNDEAVEHFSFYLDYKEETGCDFMINSNEHDMNTQ